jgi:hypothetical protein
LIILNASPAKAGAHLSAAGAAERWVPAFKGVRKWLQGGIARFEMRLTALLSMRKVFDGIKKFLILRKLRSSCLEEPALAKAGDARR